MTWVYLFFALIDWVKRDLQCSWVSASFANFIGFAGFGAAGEAGGKEYVELNWDHLLIEELLKSTFLK